MGKKAIVFGATGLVGSHLVDLLASDDRYSEILVFVRRRYVHPSPKIKTILADFSIPHSFAGDVKGDEVFCCLGTTMRQSQQSHTAFRSVDIDLAVKIAETAHHNGIPSFIVISSIGASARSRNFYLRTKGKMELKVKKFAFKTLVIVRPSLLLGKRTEKRMAEKAGQILNHLLGFALFGKWKKYKAIHASTLACAMIDLANTSQGNVIAENDLLLTYRNKKNQ